jgi:predicted enzyme related to lactoylglutathione lyase
MATIVHFDIGAEDPQRAKEFYEGLFNWRIVLLTGPVDYYWIETGDIDGEYGLTGGIAKREPSDQGILNFIGVTSIDKYIKKVEELGGEVIESKKVVPGSGCLAICRDTEKNVFGLWQDDMSAI